MTARAWKVEDLVLVPFGAGQIDQVAVVVKAPDHLGAVVVRKWTSHKGRFLKACKVPVERIIGRPKHSDSRRVAALQAIGDARATVLDRLSQKAFTRAQGTALASCWWGVCPDCYELQVPILRAVGRPAAGFEKLHTC